MDLQVAKGTRLLRRFFFGLWPDQCVRKNLVCSTKEAVQVSGGRAVTAENLHITVAFLGSINKVQLGKVRAVSYVTASKFVITLDTLHFHRSSRMLWLVPHEVPEELVLLQQSLWDGLEQAGYKREYRLYCPHLTLARRSRMVREVVKPVVWPVTKLVLLESIPVPKGVSYEVAQVWRLDE
ncbi:MAG: RNA 2',3'-cyclic phosphodiesterase [Pseudomonadota bacterium]|nr:RNA 2',3'-cyclic phosphodiesterase [Pseudomonadota bacterium]